MEKKARVLLPIHATGKQVSRAKVSAISDQVKKEGIHRACVDKTGSHLVPASLTHKPRVCHGAVAEHCVTSCLPPLTESEAGEK